MNAWIESRENWTLAQNERFASLKTHPKPRVFRARFARFFFRVRKQGGFEQSTLFLEITFKEAPSLSSLFDCLGIKYSLYMAYGLVVFNYSTTIRLKATLEFWLAFHSSSRYFTSSASLN